MFDGSPSNPLSFPVGRVAGFNPAHVAAKGVYFSAVSVGTRAMRNVLNGVGMASNATTTGSVGSHAGPVMRMSNFQNATFTGMPSLAPTESTVGGIFTATADGQLSSLWGDGIEGAGPDYTEGMGYIQKTVANLLNYRVRAIGDRSSGVTVVSGNSYFMGCSSIKGVTADGIKIVVRNLQTGVITPSFHAGDNNAVTGTTGTITFGDTGQAHGLSFAAAMSSHKALSMSELLQWAADPWSFWYPEGA